MIEVFSGYIEHNDAKSEGEIGFLNRQYMEIDNNSIHYISIESNELEKSEFLVVFKEDTGICEFSKEIKKNNG